MMMLFRVPLLPLAVGDVEQLLGGQRQPRRVARDPRQGQDLVGLGGLESAGRLVGWSPCGG